MAGAGLRAAWPTREAPRRTLARHATYASLRGSRMTVQMRVNETRRFSLRARARSFFFAGRGVCTMIASQHNAWVHAAATLLVVIAGLLAGLSRLEWFVV